MACSTKTFDQVLELQNPRKLHSPVIEDDHIINKDPGIITEEMLNDKALWHHTCRFVADKQKVEQAWGEQIKQHTEEENLLASPVKTQWSLANSNCPTTRKGPSSSADLQRQVHTCGAIPWTRGSQLVAIEPRYHKDHLCYHCLLNCRLFGS